MIFANTLYSDFFMKILINAYALGPNKGSEPGMAWNWCVNLARTFELFIITEEDYHEDIEKEILRVPQKRNLHIYYNSIGDEARKMCKNQGDWRFYWYYRKWQLKTLEIAKEICSQNKIDIIHQLNMIGFREPGYLWKLEGPKYVWGPIGGMNIVPLRYLEGMSINVRLKYWVKNFINKFQMLYHPRVYKALNRADVLIAANGESYRMLGKKCKDKEILLINEAGCNDLSDTVIRSNKADTFDILWVGRILPTKLLGFALEVISKLKGNSGLRFHIVGSASNVEDVERYKAMAESLGISDICHWHGWISHDEVQVLMRMSKLLMFTSVSEGTPHVVLEAIANRLPVVCFDICGQGDVISNEIGRRVGISSLKQSVGEFACIITELIHHPSLLEKMSKGCESAIRRLSWQKKIDEIADIYQKLNRLI